MNIRLFLITQPPATPVEQPIEAGLRHVPHSSQATAVLPVALGNQKLDAPLTQEPSESSPPRRTLGKRAVCPAACARAPRGCLIGATSSSEHHGHLRVMAGTRRVWAMARRCQHRRPSDGALCHSCLHPWDSGPFLPLKKRSHGATIDRRRGPVDLARSSQARPRELAISSSRHPLGTSDVRRRQQVMPHPQPNFRERYSQGQPVLTTKRMPVSAARSGTRGRPPLGLGRSGGKSGVIRSHRASGSNGLTMTSSLTSLFVYPLGSVVPQYYVAHPIAVLLEPLSCATPRCCLA